MGNACSSAERVPSGRFIKFDALKTLTAFPRYPENKNLCIDISQVKADRYNSLVVFISHQWLRPEHNGTQPHPDNAVNEHFNVLIDGLAKILEHYAPGTKQCYVWIDFSCLNQDSEPSEEIKDDLDEVMKLCDCVFTPLVGSVEGKLNSENVAKIIGIEGATEVGYNNSATSVKSFMFTNDINPIVVATCPYNMEALNSYMCRAWCRVEILYGAHIPFLSNDSSNSSSSNNNKSNKSDNSNNSNRTRAERLFQHGFRAQILNNRRPHLIYGKVELDKTSSNGGSNSSSSSESIRGGSSSGLKVSVNKNIPLILPAVNTAKLLDPLRGKMTLVSDRSIIQELINKLKPYCSSHVIKIGYEGDFDEQGKRSGVIGIYRYDNGDVYEGSWVNDKRSGEGEMRFRNGDTYFGEWHEDIATGKGTFRSHDGSAYEGDFVDGKFSGNGRLKVSGGGVYEGSFRNNMFNGSGVYRFANGNFYEGGFENNLKSGLGYFRYNSGNTFKGNYAGGKKNGNGLYKFATGNVYEGDFREDKMTGNAVYKFASGDSYEGGFLDGQYEGVGIYRYADGTLPLEGEWKAGKFVEKTGKGCCSIC